MRTSELLFYTRSEPQVVAAPHITHSTASQAHGHVALHFKECESIGGTTVDGGEL